MNWGTWLGITIIVISGLILFWGYITKTAEKNIIKTSYNIVMALTNLGKASTSFEIEKEIERITNRKHGVGYGTLYASLDSLTKTGVIKRKYDELRDRFIYVLADK
jgi:DNA-binding PadR family transcriptional regulator